jgi:alpha-tubulin suppressor-like RCC1 family protein
MTWATAHRAPAFGAIGALALLLCSGAAAGQSGPTATGTATAISAGAFHTCAITSAGGVKCWGNNQFGELGDGTKTTRLTPVAVSGLASGVSAIAAGNDHTCAVMSAGGVKCWGNNEFGQLGDGTQTNRLTPVDVSGLANVTAIAAGGAQTCALTRAGAVDCWGQNDNGQLGDGTTTTRLAPVGVSGLGSGVAAIGAGNAHSCALTSAGGVKCWGFNDNGQLGDGTTTDRLTPVDVSGLGSGVAKIATYGVRCALTSAGGLKCWGYNGDGELGDGTTTNRLTPVDVSGLGGAVTAVAGGGAHTCAITSAGGIECWGSNGHGQLGDGTTRNRLTPVDVIGLASGVTAITAGGHTCALTSAGRIKCWGNNLYGQLGDGTRTRRITPVGVVGFGGSPPCVVPKVLGKPLAKAKTRLRQAHCRLGRVKRVVSPRRKNIVVGQSPRAGKRLQTGSKVSVKVSRGR